MQIKQPMGVLLAHAILMLIAFGVLLPTGLLLARHKWLFWREDQVGPSDAVPCGGTWPVCSA